jgi:hypothetical protein
MIFLKTGEHQSWIGYCKKFDVFNGSDDELLNHVTNLTDTAAIIYETTSTYTEWLKTYSHC